MQGYYRNLEASQRVFLPGGWFRTGDLGYLDAKGWIYLTGRAKDTIVLRGGENIEPEHIEDQCRLSPWIAQILLVGQDAKQLGALVVPDWERVQEERVRREDLPRILRQELDRLVNEAEGFRKVDRIGSFAVLEEGFAQENGMLTATLKMKRKVIMERYAQEVEGLLS